MPSRPFKLQQLRNLNREIECKDHLIAIELHFTAQQVELIKDMKEFRMFGNLRNFYCLQDHTTSNNTQWGKTRPRTKNITMGRQQLLLRPTTVPRISTEMPTETSVTSAKTVKHGTPP